jgi:hypothetical protein
MILKRGRASGRDQFPIPPIIPTGHGSVRAGPVARHGFRLTAPKPYGGAVLLKLKSRLRAAFQFKPDSGGSAAINEAFVLPTIRHEADACEAKKQHLRRTLVSENVIYFR